mmetsp:Transcript_95679/g.205291  ORF Transcript_95679/g.205291 Transcript_95679/m.205291 type:complete len:371 (+) Transcript_95679:324-1436(+)
MDARSFFASSLAFASSSESVSSSPRRLEEPPQWLAAARLAAGDGAATGAKSAETAPAPRARNCSKLSRTHTLSSVFSRSPAENTCMFRSTRNNSATLICMTSWSLGSGSQSGQAAGWVCTLVCASAPCWPNVAVGLSPAEAGGLNTEGAGSALRSSGACGRASSVSRDDAGPGVSKRATNSLFSKVPGGTLMPLSSRSRRNSRTLSRCASSAPTGVEDCVAARCSSAEATRGEGGAFSVPLTKLSGQTTLSWRVLKTRTDQRCSSMSQASRRASSPLRRFSLKPERTTVSPTFNASRHAFSAANLSFLSRDRACACRDLRLLLRRSHLLRFLAKTECSTRSSASAEGLAPWLCTIALRACQYDGVSAELG